MIKAILTAIALTFTASSAMAEWKTVNVTNEWTGEVTTSLHQENTNYTHRAPMNADYFCDDGILLFAGDDVRLTYTTRLKALKFAYELNTKIDGEYVKMDFYNYHPGSSVVFPFPEFKEAILNAEEEFIIGIPTVFGTESIYKFDMSSFNIGECDG